MPIPKQFLKVAEVSELLQPQGEQNVRLQTWKCPQIGHKMKNGRRAGGLTAFFADVFGRNRLSINKTFGDICSISDLYTNIGGEADTNRALTYRMLALAEGTVLYHNDAHDKIIAGLAKTYGGSHTAGHRLLSLATDVARYWRTLRID